MGLSEEMKSIINLDGLFNFSVVMFIVLIMYRKMVNIDQEWSGCKILKMKK